MSPVPLEELDARELAEGFSQYLKRLTGFAERYLLAPGKDTPIIFVGGEARTGYVFVDTCDIFFIREAWALRGESTDHVYVVCRHCPDRDAVAVFCGEVGSLGVFETRTALSLGARVGTTFQLFLTGRH